MMTKPFASWPWISLLVLLALQAPLTAQAALAVDYVVVGETARPLVERATRLGFVVVDSIPPLDAYRISGTAPEINALIAAVGREWCSQILDPAASSFTSGPSSVPTINPAGAAAMTNQPAFSGLSQLYTIAGPWLHPITVAVVDTGVDASHPFLVGRIHPASVNWVEPGLAPFDGANGIDDDGDGLVDEAYGHGTHLAGLIAAAAPSSSILALRAFDDDGRGQVWNIAAAIVHAVNQGAAVINLSLELSSPSLVVGRALEFAAEHGVIVVTSAGNDSSPVPRFPSSSGSVISVAATQAGIPLPVPVAIPVSETIAPFSNYGFASFAAIGTNVLGPFPGALWASWDGTSMASAVVSGIAAALLAVDPSLTQAGVEAILAATAIQVAVDPSYGPMPLGAGRVNGFMAALITYLNTML